MPRNTRAPPPASCTSSSYPRSPVAAQLPRFHRFTAPTPGLSVSASTPGNFLPARNSSEAPPPVEMCEIAPANPAWCTAATESPPPTIEIAPAEVAAATALAISSVPRANAGISKTPIGPFQTMVFAAAIAEEKRNARSPDRYRDPSTHRACPRREPCAFACPRGIPPQSRGRTAKAAGNLRCLRFCSTRRARSSLSASTSDFPIGSPCDFKNV